MECAARHHGARDMPKLVRQLVREEIARISGTSR
jgi:cell pole-organizing protein PopZ